MARKRRRRGSSGRNLFALLATLALAALVVWALWPHRPGPPRRIRTAVVRVRPTASPSPPTAPPATAPPATPLPPPAPRLTAPPRPINGTGPMVAIVVDDCGQWLETEQGYIALPIPLTLAVLPGVRYTKRIAREAAAAGKGVMLHLPMEPISHIDPGPGEISTGMTDAQIVAQTQADVAQVPLAKGVNNHEGSEATADPRVMKDVIGVLKQDGLFFLDSMTIGASVGERTARNAGVPTAARDVFFDDEDNVAYSESMLQRAVEVAKERGYAIAIGHPRATTLAALRDYYPKMQAQGVRFVLVSQLVR